MPEDLVPTVCPYCGVGCGLYVVVEDGTAKGIEYMTNHPVNEGALCPKGNALLQSINHTDRLLYPLKKDGEKWTRISWDEALNIVSSRLQETKTKYGPNSLGFFASAYCTNEENYLFQKLARLLGTNNIDHCARL